jgi:hypothetical protein
MKKFPTDSSANIQLSEKVQAFWIIEYFHSSGDPKKNNTTDWRMKGNFIDEKQK